MPPIPTKNPHNHNHQSHHEQQKHLIREIQLLTAEMHTFNSYWRRLGLALVNGFGTVIGATLLIALLVYVLSQLATIEFLKPFVQDIVEIVQNAKM